MKNIFMKVGTWKEKGMYGTVDEYTVSIEKETEKAIQINITKKSVRKSGRVKETTRQEWLPKSQVEIIDEYIAVADWLVGEKDLPGFKITVLVDGGELKKKTGLDLLDLSAKDRVGLIEKGLAEEKDMSR
jgi:hypothetical protein